MKSLEKVAGETKLVKVNIHVGGCDVPREMSAKKPFGGPHELDVDEVEENALEVILHFSTLGEKEKDGKRFL